MKSQRKKIFIFIGGSNKNKESSNKVLITNNEIDKVIHVDSIKDARAAHRIISSNSTVYVTGGISEKGVLSTCEKIFFDIEEQKLIISQFASMNVERALHSICLIKTSD